MKTYGGFLISKVKRLQAREFEKRLKECGVDVFNGAQGRILYVLWENRRLTISQIGRMTSLAKTTLTGMLDRMEEKGLVVRIPDEKNRRQIFIEITDRASQYQAEYEMLSEKMNELSYKGFSEEEITAFEDMLRRMVANLEGKGGEGLLQGFHAKD